MKRIKLYTLSQWLPTIGIFFYIYVEFIAVLISILLLIIDHKKVTFNKKLSTIFIFIFLLSTLSILTNNYNISKFIQQFSLLFFFSFCYYIYFENNKNNIQDIFDKYLKVSILIGILAILQYFIFISINKDIFTIFKNQSVDINNIQYQFRASSIIREPSYLSSLLTPAFTYLYLKNKSSRWMLLCITTAIILTFSTITYLIILIIILYKEIFISKNYLFLIVISFLVFFISISFLIKEEIENKNLQGIILRVEDSFTGFDKINDPYALEDLNLSTYATLTNLYVALNAPNRTIGTGLGTHEQSYERIYNSNFYAYGQNKQDAYSLGIRIFSEFGITGLLFLAWFLIRYFNKSSLINTATFFILLTYIIRGGHYTLYGVIFMFFLYLYSSRQINNCNEK